MKFYCSCGASYRVTGTPPAHFAQVLEQAREEHIGQGHHEVDARAAAQARRTSEERYAKRARDEAR